MDRIIEHKERLGKCNIVPIPVNHILGQILSQFCIFPELNQVYSELFSNKGVEFFCVDSNVHVDDEEAEVNRVLYSNKNIVPLSHLNTKTGKKLYFMGNDESDFNKSAEIRWNKIDAEINPSYYLENRNIIILGHNSKINDIMSGFDSFRSEWNKDDGTEVLNIMVIDDKYHLEQQDYFKDYRYVNKVVEADVYETELIKESINSFIDSNVEDTSILVLSDDMVQQQDIDSLALTNLIYVQDIIYERVKKDPDYDTDRIDVIVEILNPKNYDVVHNYNIDNIVISNRYISKMVTQISEKIELFEFYTDILAYDEDNIGEFESKEIYVKPVLGFLYKVPSVCTAADLIRDIYDKSPINNKAMVIGIAHPAGRIELFNGNQEEIVLNLTDRDKLVIYSNH